MVDSQSASKAAAGQVPLRAMVVSAVMAALALTLPVAFHAVGLGSRFLPMLLPLLLNGFLVPARWALLAGLVAPWISALATGMPPIYPPVAASVSLEAGVMALTAALLYRPGERNVFLALIPAVLIGRGTSFAVTWWLAELFSLPAAISATAQTMQGLPGVALELTVIPLVVRMLEKRRGPLFEWRFDE